MNSKFSIPKSAAKKKSSRSSGKDGDPQVFVLPPHVLQKLGIDLGSIQKGVANATAQTGIHDSKNKTHDKTKSKIKNNPSDKILPQYLTNDKSTADTNSIIETASLMKASVLLSPTFVTTDSRDREIELSTVSKNGKVEMGKNELSAASKKKSGISNTNVTKLIESEELIMTTEAANKMNMSEQQASISKVKEVFNDSTKKIVSKINEENFDEAYVSDCSNSYSGIVPKPQNEKTKSKIKIIHEEVIEPSKYNDLIQKVISPDQGTFIPVPIDSIVTAPNELKAHDSTTNTHPAEQTDDRYIDQIFKEVKSLDDININMLDVICSDDNVIDEANESKLNHKDNLILYVPKDTTIQNDSNMNETNVVENVLDTSSNSMLNNIPVCATSCDSYPNEISEVQFTSIQVEPDEINIIQVADAIEGKTIQPESITSNQEIINISQSTDVQKSVITSQRIEQSGKNTSLPTEPVSSKSNSISENTKPSQINTCEKSHKNDCSDKVVEIASYLSKYLEHKRLSKRMPTKKYENRKQKSESQSKTSSYLGCVKPLDHGETKYSTITNTLDIDSHGTDDQNKNINIDDNSQNSLEMALNIKDDFGKITFNSERNHVDDDFQCGQNDLENCQSVYGEVNYIEYVNSRLNDLATEPIDEVGERALYSDKKQTFVVKSEPTPGPFNEGIPIKEHTDEIFASEMSQSSDKNSKSQKEYAAANITSKKKHACSASNSPKPWISKDLENIEEGLCFKRLETAEEIKNNTDSVSKSQNVPEKMITANNDAKERTKTSELVESADNISSIPNAPNISETDFIVVQVATDENDKNKEGERFDDTLNTTQNSEEAPKRNNEVIKRKRGRPRKIKPDINPESNDADRSIEILKIDSSKQNKTDCTESKRGRYKRIKSESEEETNIQNFETSKQDSSVRQTGRRRNKRLRSTLAEYSSSDEVLAPKEKNNVTPKVYAAYIKKEKKDCEEQNITETENNASESSLDNKLIDDYNHNETVNLSSDQPCVSNEANLKGNAKVSYQCGVCDKTVGRAAWISHIAKNHGYLAWKKGDTPVNVDDLDAVKRFLTDLSREIGGFSCHCGVVKKYVLSYWKHVENCQIGARCINESSNQSRDKPIEHFEKGQPLEVEGCWTCALCSEEVEAYRWQRHCLREHYNIAWAVGERPINIRDPLQVVKYLKIYKLQGYDLKCKVCSIKRASLLGFYAHILTCGKTPQEVDAVMDMCPTCNKKYLCIYRQQHEAMHREKQLLEERRREMAEREMLAEPEGTTPGRRRAAEKARNVIKELGDSIKKEETEDNEEMSEGSDASIASEQDQSESETDSGDDSDASNEGDLLETTKRNCPKGAPALSMPFKVKDPDKYLKERFLDFIGTHYNVGELFPEWKSCDVTPLSDQPPNYLALSVVSCKVKVRKEFTTFKMFQGFHKPALGLYLGAAPSCMAWVPPADYLGWGDQYLAVGCFAGNDAPRLQCNQLSDEPALLQIWNFQQFRSSPQFCLGIVLPGAAWAMSWCPAGASSEDRLGLLAVACADGGTYIYCVPHPTNVEHNSKFCKLKPVAELRRSSRKDDKRVHPTAISWTMQNGQSQLIVGYADGLVADFNIESSSPLTRFDEDGVSIFLPYHDEKVLHGCITAVSHLPCVDGIGVSTAAGTTGTALWRRDAGVLAARTHLVAPSGQVQFLPGWSSVIFTTEDLSASELHVWSVGRSLMLQRALAGCARCSLLAAATGSRLRLLAAHPLWNDYGKNIRHNVASIDIVPLAPKKLQKVNDNLELTVEPCTYEEAVAHYGIRVAAVKKKQSFKATERDDAIERFPLAEMTSLAFCPAARHHRRLAAATHSGLLFVFDCGEFKIG